jgi:hypothetical protein
VNDVGFRVSGSCQGKEAQGPEPECFTEEHFRGNAELGLSGFQVLNP